MTRSGVVKGHTVRTTLPLEHVLRPVRVLERPSDKPLVHQPVRVMSQDRGDASHARYGQRGGSCARPCAPRATGFPQCPPWRSSVSFLRASGFYAGRVATLLRPHRFNPNVTEPLIPSHLLRVGYLLLTKTNAPLVACPRPCRRRGGARHHGRVPRRTPEAARARDYHADAGCDQPIPRPFAVTNTANAQRPFR